MLSVIRQTLAKPFTGPNPQWLPRDSRWLTCSAPAAPEGPELSFHFSDWNCLHDFEHRMGCRTHIQAEGQRKVWCSHWLQVVGWGFLGFWLFSGENHNWLLNEIDSVRYRVDCNLSLRTTRTPQCAATAPWLLTAREDPPGTDRAQAENGQTIRNVRVLF